MPTTYILLSILIISLISLLGIFTISVKTRYLDKLIFYLVSFATGVLLGDAFLHIIPESLEVFSFAPEIVFWGLLAGIVAFFILEKIIRWRHCHDLNCENLEHSHPVGILNIVSDAIHNLIDGILIAASFLVDIRLGITTSLAILFHEIPQELGDFSVLLHSGYKVKKALLYNLFSALFAFIGAFLVLIFKDLNINILLPITAGGFIYIAAADLIPELHKKNKLLQAGFQIIFLFFGILIMYILKFFS